ncbi:peptidase inhibitor family I36 protein [Nonomuraea sp. LPB2021202275-12-8]|uniref:peptidase inhibitor family I36 protein n=1 Tax=Nonomuraea sp. LPB2021202275-12-8 TaxID=3120159 RepID=UPI00300CEEB9
MKKLAVAGIALVASFSVLTVSPAEARLADRNLITFWEHDDYQGTRKDFTCVSQQREDLGALENKASSMANASYSGVDLYSGDNLTGVRYYAAPRSNDSDFTNNGFDNTVESLRFRTVPCD